MKKLVEMSHAISVDPKISIEKYFNSGRELIKSAAVFEEKGDLEKAFVLYLRYMTLFLEKIIYHPEYKTVDPAEKSRVKNECNTVFDLAENLKKKLTDKFKEEFENPKNSESDNKLEKRTVKPDGSIPNDNCDIDEIDRKFNFSQQTAAEVQQTKVFDPFNIGQLRDSFGNN